MSSTATRHGPSLVVPSTQNTAPVLDFRCLYTFDLRRKAKRWQDGFARFHTFNKRVMVYDEPRNFIGDTHWREQEPIQDGDELQLDKGVLIQIGEAAGKTDQDISGIFAKRKAKEVSSDGSSPTKATAVQPPSAGSARSASTASSQLRPRTLNSYWDPERGRLGRAAVPTKSPFEERSASEVENGAPERTAKRQRIMTKGESMTTSAIKPTLNENRICPASDKPSIYSLSRPTEPRGGATQKSSGLQGTENALDVASPEQGAQCSARKKLTPQDVNISLNSQLEIPKEPTKQSSKSAVPSEKGGEISSEVIVADADPVPPLDAMSAAPKARPKKPTGPSFQPHERSKSRAAKSRESSYAETTTETTRGLDPGLQGGRLRISSSKPRKKLMYNDVLIPARTSSTTLRATTTKSDIADSHQSQLTKERDSMLQEEPMSQFHQAQRDRLRQRLEKSDRRQGVPAQELGVPMVLEEHEPLFLSQEDFPAPLPDSVGVGERNFQTSINDNIDEHPPRTLTRTPKSTHTNIEEPLLNSDSDADAELARLDAILFQRPQKKQLDPAVGQNDNPAIMNQNSDPSRELVSAANASRARVTNKSNQSLAPWPAAHSRALQQHTDQRPLPTELRQHRQKQKNRPALQHHLFKKIRGLCSKAVLILSSQPFLQPRYNQRPQTHLYLHHQCQNQTRNNSSVHFRK